MTTATLAIVLVKISALRPWLASAAIRNRLFGAHEQKYCEAGRDSAERYAARLAAKIAYRSLYRRHSPVAWAALEVNHNRQGVPILLLRRARHRVALGGSLSLSHGGDLAVAVVAFRK